MKTPRQSTQFIMITILLAALITMLGCWRLRGTLNLRPTRSQSRPGHLYQGYRPDFQEKCQSCHRAETSRRCL